MTQRTSHFWISPDTRSQLIVALSLGREVTVALTVIGIPYAVLLGVLAGIVELVPMLGPFLGAIVDAAVPDGRASPCRAPA